MKERFLPIGTVVMLDGGDKPVMVTSYCVFPSGVELRDEGTKKAKVEMFEYGGCSYPEGVIDPNIQLAFNHSQIKKIIHMGLESKDQTTISDMLNKNYDVVKKEFESGKLSKKTITDSN